jgi:predicted RNase H-like HicB family nuclease
MIPDRDVQGKAASHRAARHAEKRHPGLLRARIRSILEGQATRRPMRIPRDTIGVEAEETGFVATTSLLEGVRGCGASEAEAVLDLDRAAESWLRSVSARSEPIPKELRPTRRTKAVAVILFIVLFVVLTAVGACLHYDYGW